MENELAGIKKYTLSELRSLPPEDRHAVRDEALRRHAAAVKKYAQWKNVMEELEELISKVQ